MKTSIHFFYVKIDLLPHVDLSVSSLGAAMEDVFYSFCAFGAGEKDNLC